MYYAGDLHLHSILPHIIDTQFPGRSFISGDNFYEKNRKTKSKYLKQVFTN